MRRSVGAGILSGLILAAAIPALVPPSAATECVAVAGIEASINAFLDAVAAAREAGSGTLPIGAVLFGVTEIDAADQRALDARDPVRLTGRDGSGGDYESRGPKRITVEGVFAERDTLFRIPKLVLGHYVLDADGVTLVYDPAHTVEVGERVMGIRFFKAMNHTVITPGKLSFFFEDNDGDDPDRCYDVVPD